MNSSKKKLRGWRPPPSVIPYIGMSVDRRGSHWRVQNPKPPRIYVGIESLESRLNRDIQRIWRDTDPDSGRGRDIQGDERHQQVEEYLDVFRILTSITEGPPKVEEEVEDDV